MPHAGLCHCWGSRVLPLLLAYICYLLLGATVFQILEKQAEAQSRDQFQFEKLRFLENYTCLDQRALEQFVQVIMEAWVKGVNPKGNSTNPSNWDFGSSFFFAGTVVTTIGYGNLAPSTEAGQVFWVVYALVGIPLNVIFLNHLGTGLHGHLTTLERWEDQPRCFQPLQTLGLALFLTLGILVILVFPPMVFSHVEGWSLSEGFYFAFITLSTIGFGDYVVGTDPSKHYISVYRSLAAIWILLGLAWLALVLPLGPLLLHRCSQLWLLGRELGLKEKESLRPAGSPDLRRSQSLHEAPHWPLESLPACPAQPIPPLDFPPHLFLSQSTHFPAGTGCWSSLEKRKEADMSKKVTERKHQDSVNDRCVQSEIYAIVSEPLPFFPPK